MEPEPAAGILMPIDAAISPDEAAAWPYQHTLEADLDADGEVERIVLAADTEVDPAGRPLWEDGHRWAVYVEEADTSRTFLYAQFVQFGRVEAAVTEAESAPHVTVYERGPHRRQAWEVQYGGPGQVRVVAQAGGLVQTPGRSILDPPPAEPE